MTTMKRTMLAAALAMGLPVATAHAAATTDAWITTKSKMALLTTDGVSGTAINVDTDGGAVTLHGKVPTQAEKTKAEATVKGIDGVKSVKNLLQVVQEARATAVESTDAEVKDRVATALEKDPEIAKSDVTVRSVNQGVVLLGGDVQTLTDHLRAIEIAARVPGVKRVESQVKSPDKLASAQ